MADFEDNPIKSGSPFSKARFQDSEKRFQDGEKRFEDKIDFSKEASFESCLSVNIKREQENPLYRKEQLSIFVSILKERIQSVELDNISNVKLKEEKNGHVDILLTEQKTDYFKKIETETNTQTDSESEKIKYEQAQKFWLNHKKEFISIVLNAIKANKTEENVKIIIGIIAICIIIGIIIFIQAPAIIVIVAIGGLIAKMSLQNKNKDKK